MLAALLTNLPVGQQQRSAASRYWYAVEKEEIDEVVQEVVRRSVVAKSMWEQVKDDPDIEMRIRDAATVINLSVSRRKSDEGIELMREILQEIEDEEAMTILFH